MVGDILVAGQNTHGCNYTHVGDVVFAKVIKFLPRTERWIVRFLNHAIFEVDESTCVVKPRNVDPNDIKENPSIKEMNDDFHVYRRQCIVLKNDLLSKTYGKFKIWDGRFIEVSGVAGVASVIEIDRTPIVIL